MLAAVMLGVPGCIPSPTVGKAVENDYRFDIADIPLDDGRTVTCVVYSAGYGGGVSCDWASAK